MVQFPGTGSLSYIGVMPKRTAILPLLAVAAAAAAVIPIMGFAAPGNALPDLRSDPPNRPILEKAGARLLLRFDGFVTNVGYGPLDVTGDPSVAGGMKQRRSNGDGTWTPVRQPLVKYETADGHNHFHLMNVMRYSLRRADSTAQVAPAQKVGFCLYDIDEAYGAPMLDDQQYAPVNFCQKGKPNATSLSMGVSAGWRDVYDRDLALQWVDVSNTSPGQYRIAAETDPLDVVAESNEGNNGFAFTNYTLPGYVATPVGTVTVPGGTAKAVTFAATAYGAAGTRVFRVTTAPAHGILNVAVGQTITGNQVTYTPAPGYSGPDAFQYVAASTTGSSAGFPANPGAATATVQVGATAPTPTVAISGAPAALVAGTSAQLQAAVTPAGPVTWTATAGTISADGLYVAPGTPPAGGNVTVRATSVASPSVFADATFAITAIPVPIPTPGPSVIGSGATNGSAGLLVAPSITRRGRNVVVRTTARVDGTLLVTAIRGGTPVSRCRVSASAATPASCRVRLPARFSGKAVRITVSLTTNDGQTAVARALSRATAGSAGLLATPAITRGGRNVVVRTTARANGTLLVTAIRGGTPVSRCRVSATATKRATCLVRLPARLSGKAVRITVTLRTGNGQKAVARALAAPR